MKLSNDDVEDILRLLDALPVTELQLQTRRFKLTLQRTDSGEWIQERQELAEPNLLTTAAQPVTAPAVTAAGPAADKSHLRAVTTQIPGTFYAAPKPGAAPFVQIGSEVDENTVVAIIETMKLMNAITAGCRGTVVEICLENAGFAEQGAVLMRIDPGSS